MDFSIIIGFIIFCLSFIVIYKLFKNWTIEILMMVTMNFFYLGKSIILVQRILILSIIVCSVFFSGCALEEPE